MLKKIFSTHLIAFLWSCVGVLSLGLSLAFTLYPEWPWLTSSLLILLIISLGILVSLHQKALKTKKALYSLNTLITTVLVLGIVGTLNFFSFRYPFRWDLTKTKVHTLSEQSIKILKSLSQPVQATLYTKTSQIEEKKGLLDLYESTNRLFQVTYIDPDRNPTQAQKAGITQYGTLHLHFQGKETRLEGLSEEKLTNALIKLLKDKPPVLGSVIGHGERLFSSQKAEGYSFIKQGLEKQNYLVEEFYLLKHQQIPEKYDAIVLLGPSKPFFKAEINVIQRYLDQGGRALIALDIDLQGKETSSEVLTILKDWYLQSPLALIVDPLSKMFGVDASVAILTNFSPSHPICKDFQTHCAFPFTRPLQEIPGAPDTLKIKWIAQTNPKSWAVTQFQSLNKAIRFQPGKDLSGPLHVAMAVEGKKKESKSKKETRIVVLGSSAFASNKFSRFAAGNSDFFLNSVSWLLKDESFISIRSKAPEAGRIELSQKAGNFIYLLAVVIVPLVLALAGLVVWKRRKKL